MIPYPLYSCNVFLPLSQEFLLLFWLECGTQVAAVFPGQGVADGFGEGAEGEASANGLAAVDCSGFGVFVRDPEREVYFSIQEEFVGNPGEAGVAAGDGFALLKELSHREGVIGAGGVVEPCGARFGHADRPGCEVAGVDKLRLLVGLARCEHFASLRYTIGPVGETVGKVVWTYDQAGADDQCTIWHNLFYGTLAEGF